MNESDDRIRLAVALALHVEGRMTLGDAVAHSGVDQEAIESALSVFRSAHDAATRLRGRPTFPPGFKLSVLMPAYNECRWILHVLERVEAVTIPKEIILVDDDSTDGTREIITGSACKDMPDLRVLLHDRNRGKGAAVRTAIAQATGTVCLIQDDVRPGPGARR